MKLRSAVEIFVFSVSYVFILVIATYSALALQSKEALSGSMVPSEGLYWLIGIFCLPVIPFISCFFIKSVRYISYASICASVFLYASVVRISPNPPEVDNRGCEDCWDPLVLAIFSPFLVPMISVFGFLISILLRRLFRFVRENI